VAVVYKAADELAGDMHRIARAAAVAAEQQLFIILQRGGAAVAAATNCSAHCSNIPSTAARWFCWMVMSIESVITNLSLGEVESRVADFG